MLHCYSFIDGCGPTQAAPSFPSLVTAISDAIGSLGSSGVFPKLNWSAPRVRRVCACVYEE